MTTEKGLPLKNELRQEVMLHVNEQLFQKGIISLDAYQQAKIRIISAGT